MGAFRRLCLAAAAWFALAAASALADEAPPAGAAPLQLSFATPVQLVPESRDVSGLRLTLFYGKNAGVSGLDIAALGFSQSRTLAGVQLSFFANAVEGRTTGLQAGLFGNAAGHLAGVQVGGLIANFAREGGDGVQLGLSNFTGGKFSGVQIGALNFAGDCAGLQIGVINSCRNMRGVQIGLLNHIAEGAVPWLPIANAKF